MPTHRSAPEPQPGIDFSVEFATDGSALVRLRGEIDHANTEALAFVLEGIEAAGVIDIRLDASELRFVDCSLLRVLGPTATRLAHLGGSLGIQAPSPVVRRVIELTQQEWLLATEAHP